MELTEKQKEKILKLAQESKGKPLSLLEVTRKIFEDDSLDGRSNEGKLVKDFFAKENILFEIKKHKNKMDIVLTDAQKEYIQNNAPMNTDTEMARYLFQNTSLGPLSKEVIAIREYRQLYGLDTFNKEEVKSYKYSPPNAISRAMSKVNASCMTELKEKDLTEYEIVCLQSLIKYLNSPRFIRAIEFYENEPDRNTLESQFIAYTWNKPDLVWEEVNMYIDICISYVSEFQIQKILNILNERLKEITEDPDGRASKALADSISAKNQEKDACVKTRKALLDNLIKKRSSRKDQVNEENTILKLVEALKREEEREKMIKMLEREKLVLKNKVQEFEDMEAYMARIMGVSKSEIING